MVVHKMEYPYFLFASLLLVGLSSPHGNLDPITWKPLVIVDYRLNYRLNYHKSERKTGMKSTQ